MESECIKTVKDALIAEKEATRRRSSSSAISDRDRMMMEELEKSC